MSSVPSAEQFNWMKAMRRPGVQEVTYGMAESGSKFHTLIQDGLVQNGCRVTSVVGRSATPKFYEGVWWRRVVHRLDAAHVVDHRGFPNIRVVEQVWLAASLAGAALRWRVRTRASSDRLVVVDAAYVSALPGVLLACWGGGIRRIAIVADVYTFMADVSDAGDRSGHLYRLGRRLISFTYRGVDGFVLLTEQMSRVVNRRGRPYLVMEGLVDREMSTAENRLTEKDPHPTVLYAGALRSEYGLQLLVEGFQALDDPEARLVVYGAGDFAPDLERAAARPPDRLPRVRPTPTVLRAEETAWLLVNPRPADAELTKYSFPSKNMEYLASGTPVVTTRLPGMPEEYYEHVLTIDGGTAHDITVALRAAFEGGPEDLHERGTRGKRFVLESKTNTAQMRRVIEFSRRCR